MPFCFELLLPVISSVKPSSLTSLPKSWDLFDNGKDIEYFLNDNGIHLNDLPGHRDDNETKNLNLENLAVFDNFIEARVRLPRGDEFITGTVRRRKQNSDGNLIGNHSQNPLLDSRAYEIEFQDSHVAEYAVNLLAEAMLSHCNDEGHHILQNDKIIEHAKNHKVVEVETSQTGEPSHRKQRPCHTTKGCYFCINWRDGTTSWHPLSELEESFPIEVAKYAVNNHLDKEAAFACWVPHIPRKIGLSRRSKLNIGNTLINMGQRCQNLFKKQYSWMNKMAITFGGQQLRKR